MSFGPFGLFPDKYFCVSKVSILLLILLVISTQRQVYYYFLIRVFLS